MPGPDLSSPRSRTGMLLDGPFATEAVDTSAEVASIKGMDVSSMEAGEGTANSEHINDDGGKPAQATVGKVVYVHKVLKEDDCEDERQLMWWKKVGELPYLYGIVRLYDAAGHPEAQAIAAQVRDHVANDEPVLVRWSIEGQTVERDGNHLTGTIARRVACTIKPANKTAFSGMLLDPQAPDGFDKVGPDIAKHERLIDPEFSTLAKSEFTYVPFEPSQEALRNKLIVDLSTLAALAKALEAGSADGAPGTRTGGSALQSEDRRLKGNVLAAIRDYGDHPFSRGQFRTFAKARLPEVSDEYLDRFADMAEDFRLKKHVKDAIPAPKGAAPKVKTKKAPQPVEDLDDDEEDIDTKAPPIERGTFRGQPVPVKKGVGKPVFDPKEGVLHTPIGSFRAYLPKHDGPLAAANYQKLLSSPGVEKVMDHAIGNWLKLHRRLKAGTLPAEVVAHAVMFSQLSPNCVDGETEALTKRGWVGGFDLRRDDVLLTKNPESGALEWQGMTDLRLFPDYEGPLVEISSRSFQTISTPDHRWLVTSPRGHTRIKTSATLAVNDQIHRTGEYNPKGASGLTPDEAELLGWFVTDGYIRKPSVANHCKQRRCFLVQSYRANQPKCDRIDALLQRLGKDSSKYTDKVKFCHTWRLGKELSDMLLSRASDRCLTVGALVDLSRSALESLRDAMFLGDGNSWTGEGWAAKKQLTTGRQEQAEAFQALLTMCGQASSVMKRDMSKYSPKSALMKNVPKMGYVYIVTALNRKVVRFDPKMRREFQAKLGVWCPMVPNQVFVARRRGQVFCTLNTPVPTQELQYARLHDAMKETGLDPTKPGFSAIMPNLLAQDKPDVGPKLAAAAIASDPRYRTGTQLGVQHDAAGNKMGDPSAATGRYPGEYLSISPLLANKMKNVTRYHEIHDKVVDLVQRHRHDMTGAIAELMKGKNAGNLARAAEKRAAAKGLPAPAPVPGARPALSIPGLKVKTGLYTYGMLGGGNSIVPDTHFIRNMFGLDLKKDKGTIEYLKRQMWNSNNVHLVKGYNDWYVKNHPAAQYTLNHPKWGKHFAGDPSNVAFPAFWRHWITIRPHEHFLGMGRASGHNEATVHEPYWAAVRPLMEKSQFELDLPARTAEVHRRYCDLYGEVPASMMYHQHLVPELLAEADQRQRTANTYSFLAKTQLIEEAGIELRKAVSEALDPMASAGPVIRQVSAMVQGKMRPIGRYMLHAGQVHHLEDYHGILASVLPEGPIDADKIARLHGLSWAPDLTVEPHEPQQTNPDGTAGNGGPPAPLLEVAESPPPPPAPVFEYTRAGHAAPHVLEFGMDGKAALDGSALDDAELALILDNADRGLATIKYRSAPVSDTGADAQFGLDGLADGGGSEPKAMAKSARDPGEAIQNLRQLLGHDHPDVAALASHIYEDPMVPGVGNKYAYQKFRAENRPGAYLSMDMNDMKHVNDTYGHDAGDTAIAGIGGAFRDAAAKVGTGKLFRPGGDEFVAHFPTHEEAALFARHATRGLDSVPPVAGQHQLTTSIGIGNNFADADRALGQAKARKIDPITRQRAFPLGRTPHLAHSLVPGHEGGIELHDERPPVPRKLPAAQAA